MGKTRVITIKKLVAIILMCMICCTNPNLFSGDEVMAADDDEYFSTDIAEFRCETLDDGSLSIVWVNMYYLEELGDTANELDIPASLNGKKVSSIGKMAFSGNYDGLLKINIPISVINIEDGAFWGCFDLETITVDFGNTAYIADDGVLYNKSKTKIIRCPRKKTGVFSLPNSVEEISTQAFEGCEELTEIQLSDNVKTIGRSAFSGCNSLENIKLSNNISEIGAYAFEECAGLKGIVLPENVIEISENMFYGCKSLAYVQLPKNIETIGEYAFSKCEKLTNIELPQGLKIIRHYAFESSGLTIIDIPNSVYYVAQGAFLECESLAEINISNNESEIGWYVFGKCISLTKIKIPEGVETISKEAFEGCVALEEVSLPKSLGKIEQDAFSECAKIHTINYAGNKSKWTKVVIESGNDSILDAVKKYETNPANSNDTVASRKVTGRYKDGAIKKVISKTVIYNNDFFNESTVVNGDLSKLSMLAASAAYKKTYAKELMKACGFTAEYKYIKPTRADNDHVSYIIGHKKIENKYIVAVWVKGTSGDYEWVSNFNLGTGKDHAGFKIAEEELRKNVNDYIKKKKISKNIIFWITGHSRGAAVGNLLAKGLTDKYGKSNVFAYTYATPRVSTKGKQSGYENIFNYLNPGDFVTEVAPDDWGYKRYGQDISLWKSKASAMKKRFKKVTGKKYGGFGKKGKESLLKAFTDYAGENVSSYYKKRVHGTTPAMFCQKGLGYILAGEARGYAYALSIASDDLAAKHVLGKMVIDGTINDKFAHAHCQSSYICWLDEMY